jgi:hypothetical protein
MPKQKDLKRVVRTRMSKTGESYTAARAQVVKQQVTDFAAVAGMKDASVEKRTGRDWRGWVGVLDRAGARSKPHGEIATLLYEQHGLDGWWAQMVTVGYERIRGLRDKGQRRGGGYEVGKSKTLPVPMERLWAAFEGRARRRWLDAELTVKKATPGKSLRVQWTDGTPIEFYFVKKGPAKSQVALQHRELPTKARAEELRVFWGERLEALAEHLGE